MVVARLVEQLLLTPEVRGLNPVIGKKKYLTFTVNCIEKTKIKKIRPGLAHLKKLNILSSTMFLHGVMPNHYWVSCLWKLEVAAERNEQKVVEIGEILLE